LSKIEQAKREFPSLVRVSRVEVIPREKFMVYLLFYEGTPIVVGHGKFQRARVIFDDQETITPNHIKSIFVRIYHLFGDPGSFDRFIIPCKSKKEASTYEKKLHASIGGNSLVLPEELSARLFEGIQQGSAEEMVLRIALNSSFDGLSDLRKWRRRGILGDQVWFKIAKKLELEGLEWWF